MICMICKYEIADSNTISCPQCGAMPWQMPEMFLNEEQHQIWVEQIYSPQLQRWQKMQQLIQKSLSLTDKIDLLIKNNNILSEKVETLEKQNHSLTEENRILKDKSNIDMTNIEDQSYISHLTISTDEFDIVDGVLRKYRGNTKEVKVPEGTIKIDAYAFYNCSNLLSLSLPKGLKHIGYCAFARCYYLSSIILPESLSIIEYDAFLGCERLKTAKVPEKLEIPKDCFQKTCKIIRY